MALITKNLDNVIDINFYPTDKTSKSNTWTILLRGQTKIFKISVWLFNWKQFKGNTC